MSKMIASIRRAKITAALATLLTCSVAIAEEAQQPKEVIPLQVGDNWTYKVTDDITGAEKNEIQFATTEVNARQIVTRQSSKNNGSAVSSAIFDTSWNGIKDNNFKFTPHDGRGLQLPLSPGQEWKSTFKAEILKSGATGSGISKSKCLSQESLATKAGTFETFKVTTQTTIRANSDPTQITEMTYTTWYAPAVKRWVKRSFVSKKSGHLQDSMTQELIAYHLKS